MVQVVSGEAGGEAEAEKRSGVCKGSAGGPNEPTVPCEFWICCICLPLSLLSLSFSPHVLTRVYTFLKSSKVHRLFIQCAGIDEPLVYNAVEYFVMFYLVYIVTLTDCY